MESTPLIVDDPNCWNDRYSQKSYPNLNCGDILLVTNRAVQGIPNENFEEFVLAYECKHPSLIDPRKYIQEIFEDSRSDDTSLRSVGVSIMFLGQRTRDLTYMSEGDIRIYYKFLVSPTSKIFWLGAPTIRGLLVDKSLNRPQLLF
jgi:hypothetical protein